ncbi:hypothetical protein Q6346_13495 [Isoptericola sp. b490]|uniref:hypothetical protein n=1 Tax=Actinotalea lenta TaxID=3064654 RepID=UPI0027123D69|nr:hypothetical protein [Isoptericola sp. b490]MDO8122324.1 hypothetical protein [Isoptericola sp. b490]
MSRAEQGDRAFSVDELVALAIALDTTVMELLMPDGADRYSTQDGGTISAANLGRALGMDTGGAAAELRTALREVGTAGQELSAADQRHREAIRRVVCTAEALIREARG